MSSDARLAAQRSGKQIPQLGGQAKQTCPPLKVSSDIVANHPGMVPDTNLGDYLPDDVPIEFMEVDEFRFEYKRPLVKLGHPRLTTMMQRLHDWYMDRCRQSGGIL